MKITILYQVGNLLDNTTTAIIPFNSQHSNKYLKESLYVESTTSRIYGLIFNILTKSCLCVRVIETI